MKSKSDDDDENMILDKRDVTPDTDPEARPLVLRADFSYWLQDSVLSQGTGGSELFK